MDVIIRKAKSNDIEGMVNLLDQLFSIESDFNVDSQKQQKGLEMLLKNSKAMIFVAELYNRVIGMATVQTLISTAEGGPVGLIEDVVVDQAYRSKGIGNRLLAEMESWCRHQGFTRIQLLTERYNTQAINFYNRLHWHTTELIGMRKLLE